MKRSISVTSINSTDSVIPIEIEPSENEVQIRTRSNTLSTDNTDSSDDNTVTIKQKSLSPHSSICLGSESTYFSDINVQLNREDDSSSCISSEIVFSDKSSTASTDGAKSKKIKEAERRDKLKYDFVTYVKESHEECIFSVQIFNHNEPEPDEIIFATAGSNRCTVYRYIIKDESISIIESFLDADPKEVYYACCWTNDAKTDSPLLIMAGLKGIIRSVLPLTSEFKSALFGHGSAINELKIHPTHEFLLLSASKDYTVRLWNLKNDFCIAIFGGCEGHRDEILSADFNLTGSLIMSCGIDHSLKMWSLTCPKIDNAIKESENYEKNVKKTKFETALQHFPDYTTRDVHANYIDCVKWFGDVILSKSCENSIICWKPGLLNETLSSINHSNKNVTILHTFNLKDCDIWYVRFAIDSSQKIMALGTATGKVYVWDMDAESPSEIKSNILSNLKSKRTVRAISLSHSGKILIVANDEGNVFIWKSERNQ